MSDPPAHTNRLAQETSPYLLQHAHNPVDWYAWSDEAWERAKREDKPVLVSVGYAACHWCHVMERECFEDEELAALQNELVVSIKVDREERPDVDEIYMEAVQLIHGQGGWPLNMFCTPDGKPFYGGTYFPPQGRTGMPGWPDVLRGVSRAYRENREQVEKQADEFIRHLNVRIEDSSEGDGGPVPEILRRGAEALQQAADRDNGGFGRAPKFPQPAYLSLVLAHALRNDDKEAGEHVLFTLRKMAEGGIYDQLGGGFHRYAVDAIWLVPHFEKMLYDNALLLPLYLDAWRLTRDPFYQRIARETAGYLLREMTTPDGAFYASTDADSEGEEGKYFVWRLEEMEELLGREDAKLVARHFGVDAAGNFEGKSILHIASAVADVAKWFQRGEDDVQAVIDRACTTLLEERAKRVPPATDTKVIVAWNGLAIGALARAGAILEEPRFTEAAARAADFLLTSQRTGGGLLRVHAGGRASVHAFSEDYAALADGLLSLYEATAGERWFTAAKELVDEMLARFWDEESAGVFTVSRQGQRLVADRKPSHDGATPSANSLAAQAMARLYALTSEGHLADRVEAMRTAFGVILDRAPIMMGLFVVTLDWLEHHQAVAVVGEGAEAEAMRRAVWAGRPRPTVLMQRAADADTAVPQLADKRPLDGAATAYVCHGFACSAPVTDAEALRELLKNPQFA